MYLCIQCWESYIGQEFYKLAVTNILISSASTIGVETARKWAITHTHAHTYITLTPTHTHVFMCVCTHTHTHSVVSRIRWKGLGEKIGKGNFNIPKSILDLIYTQALLWWASHASHMITLLCVCNITCRLGFVFTPLTPAIILITTFILFYVKKVGTLYVFVCACGWACVQRRLELTN